MRRSDRSFISAPRSVLRVVPQPSLDVLRADSASRHPSTRARLFDQEVDGPVDEPDGLPVLGLLQRHLLASILERAAVSSLPASVVNDARAMLLGDQARQVTS